MPYLSFDDKAELVYMTTCEKDRWISVYSVAKRLGYSHPSSIKDVVTWLDEHGFIEVRRSLKGNGSEKVEIKPKMTPCEELDFDKVI